MAFNGRGLRQTVAQHQSRQPDQETKPSKNTTPVAAAIDKAGIMTEFIKPKRPVHRAYTCSCPFRPSKPLARVQCSAVAKRFLSPMASLCLGFLGRIVELASPSFLPGRRSSSKYRAVAPGGLRVTCGWLLQCSCPPRLGPRCYSSRRVARGLAAEEGRDFRLEPKGGTVPLWDVRAGTMLDGGGESAFGVEEGEWWRRDG